MGLLSLIRYDIFVPDCFLNYAVFLISDFDSFHFSKDLLLEFFYLGFDLKIG